jgi:hypothetical protein
MGRRQRLKATQVQASRPILDNYERIFGMPASKKKGKKGISENIKIEMAAGKPQKQASSDCYVKGEA